MTKEKALRIYRASAGSGKTTQLAMIFLKLLVENPTMYKHILAVTFTNKATEEMKGRIITELYGVAHGLQDDDTRVYAEFLRNATGLDDNEIQQKASLALQYILHDYSRLKIETIDKFFQNIFRHVARELDMPANMQLSIDQNEIEKMAVDRLVERLSDNSKEMSWIQQYLQESIEDEKGHRVVDRLKSFGENIFSDTYKEHSKELSEFLQDESAFEDYRKEMASLKAKSKKGIIALGEQFFHLIAEKGFSEEDFKKYPIAYFVKLKNGEKIGDSNKYIKDAEQWIAKGKCREGNPLFDFVENQLLPFVQKTEEDRRALYSDYISSDATMAKLHELRLLASIGNEVDLLCADNNTFILSNTQTLLNSLIGDTDAPFIYEKTGDWLERMMIDEFQDTSRSQWENFKPLMNECLAKGGSGNLIVGDVKQSIYRWRSGDWRLLNNITNEFEHADELLETQSLDVSYRSLRNIVQFNNAVFQLALATERDSVASLYPASLDNDSEAQKSRNQKLEQLQRAYDDVKQKISPSALKNKNAGIVELKLFGKSNGNKEICYEETYNTLKTLILEQQIQPKEIAILARSNSILDELAFYLTQRIATDEDERMRSVRFVSNEAFRLHTSPAVRILVQALKVLLHPNDRLTKCELVKNYWEYVLEKPFEEVKTYASDDELDAFLPEGYINNRASLLDKPLYDLVEKLYRLFNIEKLDKEQAYVCAFLDELRNFIRTIMGDAEDFLNEWDNHIAQKAIEVDSVDGVKLLTIHKSKGLGVEHLIIPRCDWSIGAKGAIWCEPNVAPYNRIPLVRIGLKASLLDSIYREDYIEERFQTIMDQLNLLYVAFTRAKKSLYIFGMRGQGRAALFERIIADVCQQLNGCECNFNDVPNDENLTFRYGSYSEPSSKTIDKKSQSVEEENVFKQDEIAKPIDVKSFDSNVKFMQSNESKNFTSRDENAQVDNTYQQIGTTLHYILSKIRTAQDVPDAIEELKINGYLGNDDKLQTRLSHLLQQRLQSERVADWFSDRWEVLNECSISKIDASGKVKKERPDRVLRRNKQIVVIDYKFANPVDEHVMQVRDYMNLFQQMGYTDVTGYLWYVYTNQIKEVK